MGGAATAKPALAGHVIEGCQRGDPEAPRLLLETYRELAFSLTLRFTGDDSLARDLTQEVFLTLFTRIGQFRGEANFTTWLYRLVVSLCLDERKRCERYVRLETEGSFGQPLASKSQEEDYVQRRMVAAVQSALQHLKPELCLPVLPHYVESLSNAEIGNVLRCSSAAVASRLERAHRILGRRLAPFRRMGG